MTYHRKIKQRALALIKEGYVAEKVADMLSKELKDELKTPCEKTIHRWKNIEVMQQNQVTEPVKATKETSRERLITNDGIYEKMVDIPPWLKTLK